MNVNWWYISGSVKNTQSNVVKVITDIFLSLSVSFYSLCTSLYCFSLLVKKGTDALGAAYSSGTKNASFVIYFVKLNAILSFLLPKKILQNVFVSKTIMLS